jgi:hypothetical protein
MNMRWSLALLLAWLGAATGFASSVMPQDGPAPSDAAALSIRIVSGENGINVVKRRSAVIPVVEVRDKNNLPIAGAVVNFTSPDTDPSITFIGGSRTFSTVTEMDGRASATGVMPVGSGAFQVLVTAAYDDHTASANIDQTNYATAADGAHAGPNVQPPAAATKADTHMLASKGGGMSRGAIAGIVLGIAGAAAIGIVLGLRHSKSSSSTSTIGIGTPTVGAPH